MKKIKYLIGAAAMFTAFSTTYAQDIAPGMYTDGGYGEMVIKVDGKIEVNRLVINPISGEPFECNLEDGILEGDVASFGTKGEDDFCQIKLTPNKKGEIDLKDTESSCDIYCGAGIDLESHWKLSKPKKKGKKK